jgi:hypothetical protein
VYELQVRDVGDCKSNTIGVFNKARAGLPEDARPVDMVINEILFNPRPNAFDYVEIYNRSNKILDASKMLIANRNSAGVIAGLKTFSDQPLLIFPGDHIVLTPDAGSLKLEYMVFNPDLLFTVALPSFPDDNGVVVVTNYQGDIIDEVAYSEKWHFKLINNPEGVSLERIDADGPSQHPGNWHSAASTAGYGTPGSKNSQSRPVELLNAAVEVSPKVFSPDNDGVDDVALIEYQLKETGYLANLTIFDAGGRQIRYLVKNELCGYKGRWTWDGLDEKGNKLPMGPYVVYLELFNLKGKREVFKKVVVLVRRL